MLDVASGSTERSDACLISWTVHLARRNPNVIPTLTVTMLAAGLLITLLFHSPMPGIAAILLLIGSIKEFLFPIHFRITQNGVESRSVGSQMQLAWKDARRCILEPHQITITPLSKPGRLDVFRGVTLKFARDGEEGDRAAVLAICRRCASGLIPELIPDLGDNASSEGDKLGR
jgi:hypothetical protein